jgi:hypothetical protein
MTTVFPPAAGAPLDVVLLEELPQAASARLPAMASAPIL